MRETSKSLRAYFFIVGALGILSAMMGLFIEGDVLSKIFEIIAVITSALFIYYGTKMYYYLSKSPKTLKNFIIISLGIQIIPKLINGQLFFIVGSALVGWYLIHNINKLSTSSK